MECAFCGQYRNSKWRSTPDPNDESRKKVKTRHCAVIQKYISGDQEVCDKFEPDSHFFCNRYNYQLTTAECVSRRKKKISRKCSGSCRQYLEVIELHKAVVFFDRKKKADAPKSVLIRRTKQEVQDEQK
jgi:hypothetical protein